MFAALTLVLTLELLTFGGVLRHVWLAAFLLAILGFSVLFVRQIARGKLDSPLLSVVGAILVLSLMTGTAFATALLAGAWAWHACKTAPGRITRFLHVLILVGILEAALGFFQYFVQPGWIFGYQNMFNRVSGTLINHNHYAGLLELLGFIPLGLAYARLREGEAALAYIYLLMTAFLALAILFSLSRMGMGSFFMSLLVLGILLKFRDGSPRNVEKKLGLGFLGLILAGIIWIGVDVVVDRYGQLVTEQDRSSYGRIALFRDTFRMIAANPLGVGTGKYQDLFRRYQSQEGGVLFDHTHNDYLESAAEWGIVPATLFWIFILVVVARTIRLFFLTESTVERGILMTCLGGIIALMIHSLADFNLQIPANATLFFAFVGMAAAFPLNVSLEDDSPQYGDGH